MNNGNLGTIKKGKFYPMDLKAIDSVGTSYHALADHVHVHDDGVPRDMGMYFSELESAGSTVVLSPVTVEIRRDSASIDDPVGVAIEKMIMHNIFEDMVFRTKNIASEKGAEYCTLDVVVTPKDTRYVLDGIGSRGLGQGNTLTFTPTINLYSRRRR